MPARAMTISTRLVGSGTARLSISTSLLTAGVTTPVTSMNGAATLQATVPAQVLGSPLPPLAPNTWSKVEAEQSTLSAVELQTLNCSGAGAGPCPTPSIASNALVIP